MRCIKYEKILEPTSYKHRENFHFCIEREFGIQIEALASHTIPKVVNLKQITLLRTQYLINIMI